MPRDNEQVLHQMSCNAAGIVHGDLAGCLHCPDLLWEADNLMLWILYVTSPHLINNVGPRLCVKGIADVVVQLDPNGVLSHRWREKFLALVGASVAELPEHVARWVRRCFASDDLSEDMSSAIRTYAIAFAQRKPD